MRVSVYKTFELDDNQWQMIVDGFNESFGLHATINKFKKGWYVSNPWGYAFHALALDDEGELMAYNVFTPIQYNDDIKAVVSGSTFVRKKFRKHIMLFAKMIAALRTRCLSEGFSLEVGVPNHNSLDYHLKINKVSYVADLSYYMLPISLSKSSGKHLPKPVDLIWKQVLKCHLLANQILSYCFNTKENPKRFSVNTNEDFYRTRFSNTEYQVVDVGSFRFVFRVYEEEGRRVAYLMDFREYGTRTYQALVKAVKYIVDVNKNVDAVLFVGFMHLKQGLMVKLPKKIVPKRLPLTCYVIDQSINDKFNGILNSDNWSFSLMNFDVR